MLERNFDRLTVNWIMSLLQNRTISIQLSGESLEFKTVKGCPQGGVLSPLLWSLVIDSAISTLDDQYIHTEGYADDLVMWVVGKHASTVSSRMQEGLRIIADWCTRTKLNINPQKVSVIPFTRRKHIEQKLGTVSLF